MVCSGEESPEPKVVSPAGPPAINIAPFIVPASLMADNESVRLGRFCRLNGVFVTALATARVDLPRLPRDSIQGREPAPSPAKRVDAYQVTHIENFTALLRRV